MSDTSGVPQEFFYTVYEGSPPWEIGAPQEKAARQRLAEVPGLELADTVHDGSGHPRVLKARWRP